MSGFVFISILMAAFMHACWNTLMKSAPDKNLETAFANFFTALFSVPFLLIFGLPEPQTYPYILLSLALHLIYFYVVAAAYRFGDLSLAYPIMRGLAPIFTLLFSFLLLNEVIEDEMILGVLLISLGVVLLGLQKTTVSAGHSKAFLFACGNAIIIAAYTIVDGQGARLSGNAWSYVGLLMFMNGLIFPALLFWQRKRVAPIMQSIAYLKQRVIYLLIGGFCIIGSYSIALWAMTQAPISLVAAIRETSVLFAFLFAIRFLRERLYPQRVLGIIGICIGLIVIRMTQS